MFRNKKLNSIAMAVALLVILTGVALALVQVTRDVDATVDVIVIAPEGIEIYLDEGLTQPAGTVEFGSVDVDPFGTLVEELSVPVWVKNISLSNVRLTLSDNFDAADVVFVGEEQEPVLAPDEVLAGELSLHFTEPTDGSFEFTLSFLADGPVPAEDGPEPQSSIEITMAVVEVSDPFGDFQAQTYQAAPREAAMGFFDSLLVHDGVDRMAPFAASAWSINTAGSLLTLTIRDDLKVNTPQVFAGVDFGFITAEDVAWNMNRQNAVVNSSLDGALDEQLGDTFGECTALNDSTVICPFITDNFWGIPITEFSINDTNVRLDSKRANLVMGDDAIKFVPVGSGPFTFDSVISNDRIEVTGVNDHAVMPGL